MAFRIKDTERQYLEMLNNSQKANAQQAQALSNLQSAKNGLDIANGKQQSGGLGSVLSGLAQSVGNVWDTFRGATNDVVNGWRDVFAGNDINSEDSFTQQGRKKIYGGENAKERYKMAGGKGLDAAATLSDLIPGVGGNPLFNAAQGAASGFGQSIADNPNASAEDLAKASAAGGVGGLVGGVAGKGLDKLGGKQLNGILGKAQKVATSQLGRGAIGGATAGAAGAGTMSALNGDDLSTVLSNMAQGARSGAEGGATMAGIMGLGGTLYGKAKNRLKGSQTGAGAVNAPIANELPNTAQKSLTGAQNAPEAEVLPRKIAVTDYDAGTEQVPVTINKTNRKQNGKGQYIDGYTKGANLPEGDIYATKYADNVVKGKNLPNAELPTNDALIKKLFGIEDNPDYPLATAIERGAIDNDPKWTLDELKNRLDPADYSQIKDDAASYWHATHPEEMFGSYSSKSDLPKIDLDDYKDYWLGRYGQTRSDIEPELLPFVEKGGRKLGSNDWTDIGLKAGEFTQDDVLDKYREFARTDMRPKYYTNENLGASLAMNDPIRQRLEQSYIDDFYPTRKIDVEGTSAAENIPVRRVQPEAPQGMAEPTYTKRTLGAVEPQETAIMPKPQEDVAAQPQETALIQPGTPEYAAFKQQEALANKRRELERQIVGGIRDQYGTTRMSNQIEGLPEAILDMSQLGLTSRAEIDGFADRITGKDGIGSKLIRKSLDRAGDIDARIPTTMEEVYNRAGAGANKNVQKRINQEFESIGKKYRVNEDGTMSRLDMYDLGKDLEKEGYKMLKRGKRNENSGDYEYGAALVDMSQQYIDKATAGVDVASNLDVNALKNALPGNAEWAKRVDALKANPNLSIQDIRGIMANPTKMSLLSEAEKYNMGTYGQRVADTANTAERAIRGATSANPVTALGQVAASKFINSKAGKQMAIKKAQKNLAKLNAGETPNANTGKLSGLKNAAGKITDAAGNLAGRLTAPLNNTSFADLSYAGYLPTFGEVANRQIARQAANNEAGYANNRAELQNAATGFENAYNDYATATAAAQQAQAQADAFEQSRMAQNSPLSRISDAMNAAMAAGDITAWQQLAELYTDAQKIYGAAEETSSNPYGDLKAAQVENINKVDNAGNSIDELEALFSKAGGGKGLIGGNIANFQASLGLNNDVATYNSLSQGLINQIMAATGKTDTLNTEAEVRRALQLVPQFTDTQEVAQGKLEALRQMLGNTKQTMLQNYGVAQ